MKIRKQDYVITFFIIFILYGVQLNSIDLKTILTLFIVAVMIAIIIGTITNFVFKSKKNSIKE